jgi:hypothetical protein
VVHAWGLNLVVVTLRITPPWGGMPLGLPILMRVHRKGGPGLIELAETMLGQIAAWLPQRTFQVCGDGFYATLAGRSVPGQTIMSRMRRDAALYELPPRRRPKGRRGPKPRKGRRLPCPQQMVRSVRQWQRVTTWQRGRKRQRLVYARPVIWYRVSPQPALLVISRDPAGKEADDFFFTTDLGMKPAAVIGAFAGRWSIEETFKNAKQLLGGQQLQSWQRQGPERAAGLSLWLYSLTWHWYLGQQRLWQAVRVPAWYAGKRHPSFADALRALRRVLWQERIKSMFGKRAVHEAKFEFLIESLAWAA